MIVWESRSRRRYWQGWEELRATMDVLMKGLSIVVFVAGIATLINLFCCAH
jgi:hypothetical protein